MLLNEDEKFKFCALPLKRTQQQTIPPPIILHKRSMAKGNIVCVQVHSLSSINLFFILLFLFRLLCTQHCQRKYNKTAFSLSRSHTRAVRFSFALLLLWLLLLILVLMCLICIYKSVNSIFCNFAWYSYYCTTFYWRLFGMLIFFLAFFFLNKQIFAIFFLNKQMAEMKMVVEK